ncbi:MAG: selenocysteine-specific translation elongation factor [Acidobacteriota bacterium]
MHRRVIGTAGHIDHGKTTLVRALTGVDCDRLPEEKRRGITIDLGFANWTVDDLQISFIDVPGHERFVKNMLAGVGGIDSVLLVVAADESIKPQTREHFAICRLLRIPSGVIAITKSDLVDPDILEIVRMEIEELTRGSFLENQRIVPVSSVSGSGIDELREAILKSVRSVPDRASDGKVYRLPIDRAFTMKGFGSVVTGTSISGTLSVESEIEILPPALLSRARNIQVHGAPRQQASAGERTSINVADVALHELRRGQQITPPGSLRNSQILTARMELLPDAAPLRDGSRIRFHHYSAELLGSLRIIGSPLPHIAPGTTAFVQIRLESPVVAVTGDRFVIRRYSPSLTVGGGVVLDAHLPKLGRKTRPEILDTLAAGALVDRLPLLARLSGPNGITLHELQIRTGTLMPSLGPELEKNAAETLIRISDPQNPRWIHIDHVRELRRRAMVFLRSYFESNKLATGVPKGEFVQKLFGAAVDSTAVSFYLRDFAAEKIIALDGDAIDVPGRSREVGGAEGELARTIELRFRNAALQPPPVSELIHTIQQKPRVIEGVVSFLVKTKVLVRIAEGVYLHRDAVTEARERLTEFRGTSVDVAFFKNLYGISRKVVIPLLELFDREGLTKRVGDRRQVM